jgi:hypothetical protein
MGVFSDVHICLRSPTPLEPSLRAKVVGLARAHELLFGVCTLADRQPLPIATTWWARLRQRFSAPVPDDFVKRGLSPYGGVSGAQVRVVGLLEGTRAVGFTHVGGLRPGRVSDG